MPSTANSPENHQAMVPETEMVLEETDREMMVQDVMADVFLTTEDVTTASQQDLRPKLSVHVL